MKWLRGIIIILVFWGAYSVHADFWPPLAPRSKVLEKRGLFMKKWRQPRIRMLNASDYSTVQRKSMINGFLHSVKDEPLKVFDMKTMLDQKGRKHYQLVKPEKSCDYIVVTSDQELAEQRLNDKPPKMRPESIELLDSSLEPPTSYREAVRQELSIPARQSHSASLPSPLPPVSQPMYPAPYQPVQPYSHQYAVPPMPMQHYPQQYVQPPYSQPMMQQMPVYQNNGAHVAAMAMQLQASAMAMQAQASALMMQAQQAPLSATSGQFAGYGPYNAPSQSMTAIDKKRLSKDQKMSQLMQYIQQFSLISEQDIHRLLLLLDTEFDIIEHLLAGSTGQVIDRLVYNRTTHLKQSSPLIGRIYDLVIDLATTTDKEDADPHLYHYFIRRGKQSKKVNGGCGKKKILLQIMYRLEQYYQMIESMQRILSVSS